MVESYRDVLSGLMEIYLSSVSIRNEITRVLTVISSVFSSGMFNSSRRPLNASTKFIP